MTGSVTDLDPAAARSLLDSNSATLIDVRDDDEWAAGHAPDATHVPLASVDPAAFDPQHQLVVVCRSGGRSSKAAAALADAGLAVHNLTGGMTAWAKAGYPVVRDDGTEGTVA